MVSFEQLVLNDRSPIYLQIVRFVQRGIISGAIQNQEELPSRRVLSSLLSVNPNTVQRAYKIMEDEGLIESRTGAKSCISITEDRLVRIRKQLVTEEIRSAITIFKQMGLSRQETLDQINTLWDIAGGENKT
jgi:GntR family transcriptional regulator